MSSFITVVGKGLLLKHVVKELSPHFNLTCLSDLDESIPEGTELLLVLDDDWNPLVHQKAEQTAREHRIPWMRGFVTFGEGMIGPLILPEDVGCSQCADKRTIMAATDRQDLWRIHHCLTERQEPIGDEWVSQTGIIQMASLIGNEVHQVMKSKPSSLKDHITLMNMRSLETSRHYILPDSLCSVCGDFPEDSASAAEISLQPSVKINENNYRCRSIKELSAFLSPDYLDPRTGMLNSKMIDFETPFADVVVNLPLMNGDEGSAGRTNSYAVSELTAILEGLERSCGVAPRGKRPVVHDCYNNLKSALNPRDVGVHTKEQYAKKNFPFTPFDPDKKMDWVWGYSLIKESPVLVPQLLAYYSMGCGGGMFFETSNGCAIGGSLEEAIFHGMMEVMERDSFLMTWYAQLPLPRIDPYSFHDKELTLMIDRMREVAGYDLYLYNATMEHGIPCILTITKKRESDSDGLNLICAAGAHLDPVKAVKSAIFESVGMIEPLNKEFKKNKENYLKMLHNSSLVKKMDDHGMVYGLPEAEKRLNFLLKQDQPIQTFDEAFHLKQNHMDITEDVKDLLEIFRRLELDVIVVDQTTSEIKRNGLHCVKVLIPGMLPMTFGHHLTRVTGLERVLKVPKQLGFIDRELTIEELNPYPHPFP
ncbi:TOMM precursor leader peptide-binding protein [Halobacillus mangrovi]|uniref:TOMM precursor leader peptide-binding protein n=1 Tax=Halobacillus mangrovi TaxID=402384 RepID=UPI003D983290